MDWKYGFIGAGNMSTALVKALVEKVPSNHIGVSNRTDVKAKALTRETGSVFSESSINTAKRSEILVLGVKPQNYAEVFEDIKGVIAERTCCGPERLVIVTMAAGITTEKICEFAGKELPVIRIMPNTPSAIGEGTILVSRNSFVDDDTLRHFLRDFEGAGTLVTMEEKDIDAASTISGCGPAYIYMYIEAMAKAGVSLGLDLNTATELAISTVRGTAGLAMKSSETLSDLRHAVCSPGGTTIEGVRSLKKSELDSVVEKALKAAYERTLELAKE